MIRIYVRASTKDQDAERALDDLIKFSQQYGAEHTPYVENASGTKLNRPILQQLLEESEQGDVLLVESVDRLSRLTQDEFATLKQWIKEKGLRLIVADLPTTHTIAQGMTGEIMAVINNMLIDLLATMAKIDNDKRRERIIQGMARAGYVSKGKAPDLKKHQRIKDLREKGLSVSDIAMLTKASESTVKRVIAQGREKRPYHKSL